MLLLFYQVGAMPLADFAHIMTFRLDLIYKIKALYEATGRETASSILKGENTLSRILRLSYVIITDISVAIWKMQI